MCYIPLLAYPAQIFGFLTFFYSPPPAEEGPTPWLLQALSRSRRALHPALRRATGRASAGLLTLQPQGRHAVSDPPPGRAPPGQPARQEGRRAKERERRWKCPRPRETTNSRIKRIPTMKNTRMQANQRRTHPHQVKSTRAPGLRTGQRHSGRPTFSGRPWNPRRPMRVSRSAYQRSSTTS